MQDTVPQKAEVDSAQRERVERAIGHFILDLGMIEGTMIQALAALVSVPPTQAHFLLSKTAGGAKADLLKEAAIAKGIDVKTSGLKDALGTIHKILNYRNQIVHDAIAFHGNRLVWIHGKGSAEGDSAMGKISEIDPNKLAAMSKEAWSAIAVIGREILQKYAGYTYVS